MEKSNKKKINMKFMLMTIIIILFIITVTLSVVYYIVTTPQKNVIIKQTDTVTTKTLYNSQKDIPVVRNVNEDIAKGYVYLDMPTDLEMENVIITSRQDLLKYSIKCTGGNNSISFYNDESERGLLEYFDEQFFEQKNLVVLSERMSGYSSSIEGMNKQGENLTISIKQNYDVNKFIIPVGIDFCFISIDKDITHVNFDIYQYTVVYKDNNLQLSIIILTIILIVSLIVFLIIYIANLKNKSKKEYDIILSIVLGVILSILILALAFGGIILFGYLLDYYTLSNG